MNDPLLTAFYKRLRKSGGANGEPLSVATARHVHNIPSGAFRSAVKAGLMSVNPCTLAEVPSGKAVAKRKPTVWSPKQLRAFLDSEEGSEHYPLWLLIAATGCRRGEALGLTWERVNLDAGTLLLDTVGVQRVKIVRKEVPKGKECRTVHVPAGVVAAPPGTPEGPGGRAATARPPVGR